jgi:hypothetical protein
MFYIYLAYLKYIFDFQKKQYSYNPAYHKIAKTDEDREFEQIFGYKNYLKFQTENLQEKSSGTSLPLTREIIGSIEKYNWGKRSTTSDSLPLSGPSLP